MPVWIYPKQTERMYIFQCSNLIYCIETKFLVNEVLGLIDQ